MADSSFQKDIDIASGETAQSFPCLNHAYNSVFQPDRLSIGLVVPIERYASSAEPTMRHHVERAKRAEELGFSALWIRDVPFNVPTFGDAGQMFDPFAYLGYLAAVTKKISLGVASVILPLRHPAHVAKAAASVDVLSGGRALLGVASGDRAEEYPAMNKNYSDRGERFRDAMEYLGATSLDYPKIQNPYGLLDGQMDLLPKPTASHVPLLVTGGSQQNPDWIAQNGDGWMTYPRDPKAQAQVIGDYRARSIDAGLQAKPVMQSLYVDLVEDDDAAPRPIHLGFCSGSKYLRSYLTGIKEAGVNHVALNLRFNRDPMECTLERLASNVLAEFAN